MQGREVPGVLGHLGVAEELLQRVVAQDDRSGHPAGQYDLRHRAVLGAQPGVEGVGTATGGVDDVRGARGGRDG